MTKTINNNRGFTLIELLVVISIIALLLSILMPALDKAKGLGKRVVCLHNARQLTLAWRVYAEDNDDEICAANVSVSIWGWVGPDDPDGTPEEQIKSIREGALFPYLETMEIYTCPTAEKGEVRSYSIVASMNTDLSNNKGTVLYKFSDIKGGARRLVFVCEGDLSPNAFRVWYDGPVWKDHAPIRHGRGTILSFADGHSDYWIWRDPRTEDSYLDPYKKQENPPNPDLERVQIGMWGELGYDP